MLPLQKLRFIELGNSLYPTAHTFRSLFVCFERGFSFKIFVFPILSVILFIIQLISRAFQFISAIYSGCGIFKIDLFPSEYWFTTFTAQVLNIRWIVKHFRCQINHCVYILVSLDSTRLVQYSSALLTSALRVLGLC